MHILRDTGFLTIWWWKSGKQTVCLVMTNGSYIIETKEGDAERKEQSERTMLLSNRVIFKIARCLVLIQKVKQSDVSSCCFGNNCAIMDLSEICKNRL